VLSTEYNCCNLLTLVITVCLQYRVVKRYSVVLILLFVVVVIITFTSVVVDFLFSFRLLLVTIIILRLKNDLQTEQLYRM